MSTGSFYAEYRPRGVVYHGAPDCGYVRDEDDVEPPTFRCSRCKRTICYCGGHTGLPDSPTCFESCPRCDECCDGPEETP